MPKSRRRLAAVSALAAVALGVGLTGCGSSSSSSDTSTAAAGGEATLTTADGSTWTVTLAKGVSAPIDIYGNDGGEPVGISTASTGPAPATVGKPFAIAMPQSPSTGYAWKATGGTALGTVAELVEDGVNTADPGTPGSPGTHYFVYNATAAGTGTLTYALYAPGATKATKTQTVTVDVSK